MEQNTSVSNNVTDSAPVAEPTTSAPAGQSMRLVGFGPRFAAIFIDFIIVSIVQFIVTSIFGGRGPNGEVSSIAQLINFLVSSGYYIGFLMQKGGTPGKMALGIKVVREDGKPIDFVTALLREWVGRFVDAVTIGIGVLWVLWDPKKQALHDKIAKTLVVYNK